MQFVRISLGKPLKILLETHPINMGKFGKEAFSTLRFNQTV
jgi:hypothetical protein